MVVAILVMLAGARRENASWANNRLPEPSSRTATCGAVTCGGGSPPCFFCGPVVAGVGWVATSGGGIRINGAVKGSGKCAGGAARSQNPSWATSVASGVAVGAAGVAVDTASVAVAAAGVTVAATGVGVGARGVAVDAAVGTIVGCEVGAAVGCTAASARIVPWGGGATPILEDVAAGVIWQPASTTPKHATTFATYPLDPGGRIQLSIVPHNYRPGARKESAPPVQMC